MTDYFHLNMERDALLNLSSLGLAHLGDSVFEVMIRSWLCLHGKAKVKDQCTHHDNQNVRNEQCPSNIDFAVFFDDHCHNICPARA